MLFPSRRSGWFVNCAVLAFGLILAPGCDSTSPGVGEQDKNAALADHQTLPVDAAQSGGEQAASPSAQPAEITLQKADEKEFAAWLETQRGRVVFVDFWATWCVQCVELFPHTVDLHKKFGNRGLAIASISFDDPAEEAPVKEFLTRQGATFANFITPYDAMKAAEAFAIDGGALPHFRLYDREGKLVKKFFQGPDSKFQPSDIDREIESLLAAGPPP